MDGRSTEVRPVGEDGLEYFDIARVLYPHGVPSAGTAGVVAVLHDGAVAGHTFYVQDPLFP